MVADLGSVLNYSEQLDEKSMDGFFEAAAQRIEAEADADEESSESPQQTVGVDLVDHLMKSLGRLCVSQTNFLALSSSMAATVLSCPGSAVRQRGKDALKKVPIPKDGASAWKFESKVMMH